MEGCDAGQSGLSSVAKQMFRCSWGKLQGGPTDSWSSLLPSAGVSIHCAWPKGNTIRADGLSEHLPGYALTKRAPRPALQHSQSRPLPLSSWQGDPQLCPLSALKVLGKLNGGSLCLLLWPSLAPTGKWGFRGQLPFWKHKFATMQPLPSGALTGSEFTHTPLMTC